MQAWRTSFFEGISDEEMSHILRYLEPRRFAADSTVVVEGDNPRELSIIQSGKADVFIAGREGGSHLVARLGPGAVIGEMSLLTGQPASATVRATSDVEVLALNEANFHAVATQYPAIYRNVGAILSEKLARSDRRWFHTGQHGVIGLLDHGAPPTLGYLLACSFAWHTQASVLLVVMGDDHPADLMALSTFSRVWDTRANGGIGTILSRMPSPVRGSTQLLLAPLHSDFSPESLPQSLDDLCAAYDYVMVQVRGDTLPFAVSRSIRLAGVDTSLCADDTGKRLHTIRAWAGTDAPYRPDREGILSVPFPEASDEILAAKGALPPHSPAGKALGWAARDIAGLKVGLALGAGSSKGYGHVGVLQVLDEVGVPVDYIAGTSIGGCVAALRAFGFSADDIVATLDKFGASIWQPTVPTASLLSNGRIRSGLQNACGDRRIESLHIPLALVAADIESHREIVFKRGLVWPALLASVAIPGIFPALRMGPLTLVDGGVVNPVPSNVVSDMGADTVIAVRLGRRRMPPGEDYEGIPASGRGPSLFGTIMRSIEMMQNRMSAVTAGEATVLIDIDFTGQEDPGIRYFSKGRQFIELGERTAREALPRLTAAFPWLQAV